MVVWSAGSDSNDHCVEYVSSASDDGTTQISGIPHYSSLLQLKTPNSRDLKQSCLFCAMGMGRPHRGLLRAFEGIHTGRRFLCCAEKSRLQGHLIAYFRTGLSCPLFSTPVFVYVNSVFLGSKIDRTEDNLMNSFVVHNLTTEKKKLQDSYEKLVEDVSGLLDAQERRAEVEREDLESSKLQEKYDMVKNLAVAQAGVTRNMKRKLAEERKNLQIHIDELQKSVEQCNVKLEGIKVIING
ncbi:hypothetical protein D1007_50965 [Hordeum vulgare]|nr:hypothetical protein D1007_50965 [Hordeum vulgare]